MNDAFFYVVSFVLFLAFGLPIPTPHSKLDHKQLEVRSSAPYTVAVAEPLGNAKHQRITEYCWMMIREWVDQAVPCQSRIHTHGHVPIFDSPQYSDPTSFGSDPQSMLGSWVYIIQMRQHVHSLWALATWVAPWNCKNEGLSNDF